MVFRVFFFVLFRRHLSRTKTETRKKDGAWLLISGISVCRRWLLFFSWITTVQKFTDCAADYIHNNTKQDHHSKSTFFHAEIRWTLLFWAIEAENTWENKHLRLIRGFGDDFIAQHFRIIHTMRVFKIFRLEWDGFSWFFLVIFFILLT